ncbi:MAG TPA: NnrS family protein [Aestuariivirgaceae bacterium]|jgi:uncharacterized protein involved in response to NO
MRKTAEQAVKGGRPRNPYPSVISLFSYGFRPLFLGAAIWAIVAVALWSASVAGLWPLGGGYGALPWHAHEMLFGYGSAVVAGFLLTAVPNWTGSLPIAGWRLAFLFLIWCLGRLAFLVIDTLEPVTAAIIEGLFLPLLLVAVAREVVVGRNWRNLPPLALVTLLAAGNIAFHADILTGGAAGLGLRIGVVALVALIVLIGGRITPSFTHNWLMRAGSSKLPAPFGLLDKLATVTAGAALGVWVVGPAAPMTALLFFAAASLVALRLARWQGIRVWREPLLVVLHVGYAFVPVGFFLGAVSILWPAALLGTAALHAWTVGAVGLMTLGVMTRATRGHTGREQTASMMTVAIYTAMFAAACLRIAAGFFPLAYLTLLELSAALWVAAFTLFLIEYGPMLVRPRLGSQ